jgi:hypothetical protein
MPPLSHTTSPYREKAQEMLQNNNLDGPLEGGQLGGLPKYSAQPRGGDLQVVDRSAVEMRSAKTVARSDRMSMPSFSGQGGDAPGRPLPVYDSTTSKPL